ncbi:MAG: MazG nucleotide pyrophosphohydrolase domain-containing protein [bacterium]|nr:MazG nucleotide pyrophosphohydrolase domain-containing protein [bacterium]
MALAKKKGWGTIPDDVIFSEKIALLHGEVAEALEAYRKRNINGKDGVAEELGDIILRTLHLAGIYKIDVVKAVQKKLMRNAGRDWRADQLYLDKKKRKR